MHQRPALIIKTTIADVSEIIFSNDMDILQKSMRKKNLLRYMCMLLIIIKASVTVSWQQTLSSLPWRSNPAGILSLFITSSLQFFTLISSTWNTPSHRETFVLSIAFLLDNHMMTSTKEESKFLISQVKRALKASNIKKHIHYWRQGQQGGDKREIHSIQVRDLTLSMSSKNIQSTKWNSKPQLL